jgi:hypothetical protein
MTPQRSRLAAAAGHSAQVGQCWQMAQSGTEPKFTAETGAETIACGGRYSAARRSRPCAIRLVRPRSKVSMRRNVIVHSYAQ